MNGLGENCDQLANFVRKKVALLLSGDPSYCPQPQRRPTPAQSPDKTTPSPLRDTASSIALAPFIPTLPTIMTPISALPPSPLLIHIKLVRVQNSSLPFTD